MKPFWEMNNLEIAGYANVLKETMLPSVVPPVFRLKADIQRAFLPPYAIKAGFLFNATEVPHSELEELRNSQEITLFDTAFPARAEFELWVDTSFQTHYQSLTEARANLSEIASDSIQKAKEALATGNLEEAERLSGMAMSADDRRVEPLAIKAAIRRMIKNPVGERLMAKLASGFLSADEFWLLVDKCFAILRDSEQSSLTRPPSRATRGIACVRPDKDKAAA